MAAFSFYSSGLPHDEQALAKGLLAAIEKAPFLERFVDRATKQLTDEARTSLEKLQEGQVLTTEGNSLVIPPTMREKLSSQIRMYFKNPGIEALQQAAEAAGKVWSPQ